MSRRQSTATLQSVLDDHIHWLGQWQRAVLFPDKVSERNPYGPDTLLRWLADPQNADYLNQPAIRRLQLLQDQLQDQADDLGKVAPRSRPPFEAYDDFLRNFDSFVGQMRRVERLMTAAAVGLDLKTGLKNAAAVLRDLAELMARAEGRGETGTLAAVSIDAFDQIKAGSSDAVMDFILMEVAARITHNLRPFDDVYRLDDNHFLIYLHNAKVADARIAADRVRRKVAVLPIELPTGMEIEVGISLGLEQIDFKETPDTLVARAVGNLKIAQSRGLSQITGGEDS